MQSSTPRQGLELLSVSAQLLFGSSGAVVAVTSARIEPFGRASAGRGASTRSLESSRHDRLSVIRFALGTKKARHPSSHKTAAETSSVSRMRLATQRCGWICVSSAVRDARANQRPMRAPRKSTISNSPRGVQAVCSRRWSRGDSNP